MLGNINEDKLRIGDLNFRLIVYVLLLSVIGVFVVHSATADEVTQTVVSTTVKQIVGLAGGLVIAAVLALIDYRKMVKYAWIFYILSILSLVYVLFFTNAVSGARRWIYFPFFGTIQPSEFAKSALILALAFVLYKAGAKINKIYVLILYFLVAMPIFLLVYKEPDLSTSVVLVILIVTALFLGGISYKWVVGVLAVLVPFVVVFFAAVDQPGQKILIVIFEPHQLQRINAYFFPENFPDSVYQQRNSVMAIGSGGLYGKGLNTTSLESVKNGNFLSEESCDFIFAVVGEELGFIGAVAIVILFALLVFECYRVSKRCTDIAGKVIAGTVGTVIGLQAFINIAVSTLLIPNTGIPLPFVSAGLSSLLNSYIMIGLVLSVSLRGRYQKRVFY